MAIAERFAATASRVLAGRLDRRGFLARTAIVGSAVATSGLDYVLRPGSAYSSVCGSGASCYSGWTAMCCTIHDGVNQCPPGSFAGGWWKADGASLCGGNARYYVDCQAECTGCGCGGGAFCSSRCWDCHSHCADGPCDKRHVCHNVFRYGQCDRDRHCSGPVLCRTITCSPPWHWADCSSASATDDETRDHSASCLSGWTHIAHRYTELGSQGSALGASINHEYDEKHAKVQRYQHGRMYYTHHTGAHYLTGKLSDRYVAVGGPGSPLGLPISDPVTHPGGRLVRCETGSVAEHLDVVHVLWGKIDTVWHQLDGYAGELGWPITSRYDKDGGSYAHFQHGSIYNGPKTPLCALMNPFDAEYQKLGAFTGVLGWAARTSAQVEAQDGTRGTIATTAKGAITLVVGRATPYAVWSHVASAWESDGGATGALGFPTATMTVDADGNQHGTFAHGTIDYDAATGQVTITPTPPTTPPGG